MPNSQDDWSEDDPFSHYWSSIALVSAMTAVIVALLGVFVSAWCWLGLLLIPLYIGLFLYEAPSEARASNPASIRISCFHLLWYYWPQVVFVSGVTLVIVAPLGLFVSRWCWLGLLLIPTYLTIFFKALACHFRYGNVCPAVVVSRHPDQIAVFTDLSIIPNCEHPVTVIAKRPLSRLAGGPANVGDRLAVVCLYEYGDPDYPQERWKTIDPIPARAGTTDPKTLQRVFDSIPFEQWQILKTGLARVPRPYRPGRYLLNENEWDDAD